MKIDLEGLKAARTNAAKKPAQKPRLPTVLVSDLTGAKADAPQTAPAVDEDAATKQFKAPAPEAKPAPAEKAAPAEKPKSDGQPTREAVVEVQTLAAAEREVVAGTSDDDVVVEDDAVISEAPAPASIDLDAVRSMVEKMLTEKLAALEQAVAAVRTDVFGEDMNAAQEVLEGAPLLSAFDRAIADKVSFADLGMQFDDNGDLVPMLDDDGNPVTSELLDRINAARAAATPAPVAVDLSGVESSLGAVEARVASLEGTMLLVAGDGSVLEKMNEYERDENGELVLDESGKPKLLACALEMVAEHCPTFDDLEAYAQRDEFGPDGELTGYLVETAEHVLANILVKKMMTEPFQQQDVEELMTEAAKCPETARKVLVSLASDLELVKEVMARADGSSMEELKKPHNAENLERIEQAAPKVRDLAEALADKLPWDAIIEARNTPSEDGTGGDA